MLKHIRFLTSATFVAILLVSTLILSVPVRVNACEDSPPATLLSLYMSSDLVVVANLTSEKDGKITTDENDYYFIEVNRNLRVSSVLKGKSRSNLIFTQTEFRYKGEQTDEHEEEIYYPYGYKWHQKFQVGERYLFFLKRNAETKQYELTDEVSGAKKLNDYELSVHEKRIEELAAIVGNKKNQLTALTEWILRCLEEEATRWDGVFMLNNSFEALMYGSESEVMEEAEEKTANAENKPFVIDKDFHGYTPEIAENLSDSQKDRISSVLFGSLGQSLFEKDAGGFNYVFANVVKNWDKSRLAMYAFSILQTTGKAEYDKTETLINYIAAILGDEELYRIVEGYQSANYQQEDEETIDKADEVSTPENTENKPAEPIVETDQQVVVKQIEVINIEEGQTTPQQSVETQPEEEKLTAEQKREKALQDFIKRYEYLLARGFPSAENQQLAETPVENKNLP